jgi:hypothetical protein
MKHLLSAVALVSIAFPSAAVDFPQPTGAAMANTFPYSMTGQLLFRSGSRSYSGSAVVVRPR